MTTETDPKNEIQIHPWRHCPYGQHWVKSHDLHIPPNNKNIDGSVTIRHAHCAKNPSGRDILYVDEISEIAKTYFSSLTGAPNSNDLGFPDGNKYDDLIRGWTKYWNDILKPIGKNL